MKTRTLLILCAGLALLGLLVWCKDRPTAAKMNVATGQAVLPDFDPNALQALRIISGTQEVALARGATGWTVASRWDYPADFDRLRDLLRALADLKVGEALRGGLATLAEFGLATADTNATTAIPAELRWTSPDGKTETRLVLGQPRTAASPESFSRPDSQYARVNDGPVLLVAPYLEEIPRRADDWLMRKIIDEDPASITAMNATLQDGTRYGVQREGDGFRGVDALAEKNINQEGAALWLRIWQNLNILTVADPARDRTALGLDQPDVVEARTRDGISLKVQLGRANEAGERPAVFTINWEAPPLPESLDGEARTAAEKAQQAIGERVMNLQKRITPWVYMLTGSAAQQFTMLQNQLITVDAPPATAKPAEGS